MPKKSDERYAAAMAKATTALGGASSQLQRQVLAELKSVDVTVRKLRGRFSARAKLATAQIETETRDMNVSLAEVRASLSQARAHQAAMRKLGNPALNDTAAILVKVSEQQLKSFPAVAESRIALIQADQRILAQFEEWMNGFAGVAASSVFDDIAPERAVALLSGLTIIGGIPGGPIGAGIVATAGSVVLLVADLAKKSTLKKRTSLEDRTIARYEDAHQLLQIARTMFEGWLRVLG